MALLILIRHGESQWNLENRFTGWVDVELSEKGKKNLLPVQELVRRNLQKQDTLLHPAVLIIMPISLMP